MQTPSRPRKSVPQFLIKLYKIVEDPSTQHLIHWNDLGDSFIVTDPNKFASNVLMRYFKHSNYTSFTRQLNYYNFKKVDQQSIPHHRNQNVTFSHPFFQRCHPEDMKNIMRKHQSPVSPRRMSPTTIMDLQHPRFMSLQDTIQHCENEHSQNSSNQLQEQHEQYQSQQSHNQQQPQGPTYLRSRAHDIRFSNFIDSELYYAPLSPPPEFSFNTSPVVPPLLVPPSYEMSDSSDDTLFSPDDLDFLLDEDSPNSNQ